MAYLKFLGIVTLIYVFYYICVYMLDAAGSKSKNSTTEIDLGHLAMADDPQPVPIHSSSLMNNMETQLAARRIVQEIPKEVIDGIETARSITL